MTSKQWEPDPNKFLTRRQTNTLQSTLDKNDFKNNLAVRNAFIIHLGLATGLRVMEIADLNCGDLNLEDAVPSLIVRNGKGKRRRRVFFNNLFRKRCIEYLAWKESIGESIGFDEPLFLSSSTGGHLTTRAIQKVFKHCARRAGLPARYSIHCLRHTYACFLLKASQWNLRLVQKQLGHSKITTTQVYADVMMPEIKKALDRLYY